jgi:hypothetical protein
MPRGKPSSGVYVTVCILVSMLGWFPILFTQPVVHGGTLASDIFAVGALVLGAYCTLELCRMPHKLWVKIVLAVWLLPYAVVVGASLLFAAPYMARMFAS